MTSPGFLGLVESAALAPTIEKVIASRAAITGKKPLNIERRGASDGF